MTNHSNTGSGTDVRLRQYAVQVAGPRDCIVNLVLNGLIAWWIFGSRSAIPLAGANSIFIMLLPMAFIESTLATYFGLRSGFKKLRQWESGDRAPTSNNAWQVSAIKLSVIRGAVVWLVAVAGYFGLNRLFPGATLSSEEVVLVIAILAGILGFALTVSAVMYAKRMTFAK